MQVFLEVFFFELSLTILEPQKKKKLKNYLHEVCTLYYWCDNVHVGIGRPTFYIFGNMSGIYCGAGHLGSPEQGKRAKIFYRTWQFQAQNRKWHF